MRDFLCASCGYVIRSDCPMRVNAEYSREPNPCVPVASEEIERLRADLEKARIQLAACGVIAMSNTPESAAKHRTFKPEYDCASLHDVMGAVDREMALRAEKAKLEKTLAEANEEADVREGEGDTLVGQIKMYVQHRHDLASQNITLRKRITELEAENAKLREAVTWRPIESAPRDGVTSVDLWFPSAGRRTNWRWYRKNAYWGSVEPDRFSRIMTCDESPTHWLPLPEAPR